MHHPSPGRLLPAIEPVSIVDFLWPIKANADEEFLIPEESAPLLVQQSPVGLESVLDPLSRWAVLFLQCHSAFKPVDSEQGGLTALPGEGHDVSGIGMDEIPDIGF